MIDQERAKTLVQFLRDGKFFKIDNLRIGMNNISSLYVTGWSQTQSLKCLTKNQAMGELMNIKMLFRKMINESSELQDFIKDKNMRYNLAFNYGMGAMGKSRKQ